MGKKEASESQTTKIVRMAEELEQKAAREQEFLQCIIHRLDASALRVAVAKIADEEMAGQVPY